MQRIVNAKTVKYSGQRIMVCGWVQTIRAHGKILFIDLRDQIPTLITGAPITA